MQKAKIKATGQIIPKFVKEDLLKLDTDELCENDFKLFGYFYLHSYCYLPNNIRYLAISSLSRIDSEPAIAIIIFRTCLEFSLRLLFEKDNGFSEDDHLADMISSLEKNSQIDDMASLFRKIKKMGNDAAHEAKNYSPCEISEAILYFDTAMDYFNNQFKKQMKS